MTDPRASNTKDLGTLELVKPHEGPVRATLHDGAAPAYTGHYERLLLGVGQARDGSLSVTSIEKQGMSLSDGLITAVVYCQSLSMDPAKIQGPGGQLEKGEMFGVEFTAGGPLEGKVVSTFGYDNGDVMAALDGVEAAIAAKTGRAKPTIGGDEQRMAGRLGSGTFTSMTDDMAITHAGIKAAAELPEADRPADIEEIKTRWARLKQSSVGVGMHEANPSKAADPLNTPHREAVNAKALEWSGFRRELKRAGIVTEATVAAVATKTAERRATM